MRCNKTTVAEDAKADKSNTQHTRRRYIHLNYTPHARQRAQTMTTTWKTYVLAIHPLLAIDLKVPRERCLEERLVLGLGQVESLVLVRLPVGRDVDDWLDVLATCNQRAADDGVIRLPKHAHRSEQVLARRFEAVEEAANLVRGHERLRELVVVLEVHTPDGEALRVVATRAMSDHCAHP